MDTDAVCQPHDAEPERQEHVRPLLPSLKELCTRVVYNNLPSITSFGEMSYEAVRPFLIRMDAQQLRCVEENSPHLIDHDEEIWKALCMREFNEIRRANDAGVLDLPGSWRDVYDEAEAAREAKFVQLQAKMKNNYKAIAHEKEAKQIKVIEKAPPSKRRAFSSASAGGGRPTATAGGPSLLAKARRAAAANSRQFGHSAAPTSAFKRPGLSSTGLVARPQQGVAGTPLYKQAATINAYPPSRPSSADARATSSKPDASFFSGSRTKSSAAPAPSRAAQPKSGIGNAR